MLKQRTTYRTSTAKHFSKALLVCIVVFAAQTTYAQFQLQVTVPADSLTATLPLFGTVNATVNWGGAGTTATETTYTTTGSQSYTYTNAGTYIISVTGTLTQFGNGATGYTNADKITKMISFGSVGLTSLSGAFYNASRLDSVPATLPSSVTDLSYMFYGATSFNCVNDTGWNVGKVTNMTSMFQNATAFNQNLSGWCVSRIASAPTDFATGASAWGLPQPVWGTCSSQFVIKVNVTTAPYTVYLPLYGTVNATVYWGGASSSGAIEQTYTSAGNKTYTYTNAGTYTISISGTVTQFGNGTSSSSYASKFTEVLSFGSVGLTSLYGAFNGATNLTSVPSTLPSTVTDLSYMFYGATSFNSTNDTGWNVSNVTNMSYMFSGATAFNQSLNGWNVGNVTNMSNMFFGAAAFNGDIGNWVVSNVTNMSYMFSADTAFNQNIGSWNVSKVTDMSNMFSYASAFNQNIGSWDVGNVTTMSNMFFTTAAFNQSLNGWNVSKVTDMSYMFGAAGSFNQDLNNWNVSNVTNMNYMFSSAIVFNQNIAGWTVSNVTTMNGIFASATAFNQEIGNWNVGKVTIMSNMFAGAAAFNADIGSWNVNNVTDMGNMFSNASAFNNNIGSWNVGKVTNMNYMFFRAAAFNQDLSGWCVSRISSIPNNFAYNATAWVLAKPVWGICSSQFQLKVTVVSGSMTVTLPLRGTVNATVYWGGAGTTATEQTYTTPVNQSFTYNTAGTYIISISGTLTQFGPANNSYPNADRITEVISWGNVGLTSLAGAFFGATNLTSVPATLPSTVTNMLFMFYGATSFNSANVAGWDVSNVTNMNCMFFLATAFNQDISNWNVSNVTSMGAMFGSAAVFNQDISNWNVGKVTNMSYMFAGAAAFNADIGSWNVGAVTDMLVMFSSATSFNQNIGSWDVSKVTKMNYMFQNANTFNKNIGNWNVGAVTDMSYMFEGASAFNQNIGTWNVSNVTNMNYMFRNASVFNQNISSWNVSNVYTMSYMFYGAYVFNGNIGSWNVSKVTDMSYMFSSATSFNQNISSWDVSRVTSMASMFYGASAFNQDLSGWCVSRIAYWPTNFSTSATAWVLPKPVWGTCSGQFILKVTVAAGGQVTLPLNGTVNATVYWGGASSSGTIEQTYTSAGNKTYTYTNAGTYTISISGTVTQFGNGATANTNGSKFTEVLSFGSVGLTSLSGAFNGATNLISVPATLPSTVTDLSYMFKGATLFNSANDSLWDVSNVTNMSYMFYGAPVFNRNIGSWNVGNVTNMSNMFYNASAFNQNIGSWVVSKVTNMDGMFMGASAFNQDIGNWNVGNVTTMNNMFTSAAAFNKNIGTWNVANVTSMSAMFSGATVFNQNIGSWNVGNVTNMYDMFHGLTSFNQNIGSWNVGNVTNMIQMFYNASSFNQDLSGWCVSRVPSIPSFFATGANAWVLPKPVWGTCTSQFQLKVTVTDTAKTVTLPLRGTVNATVYWGGSGTTAIEQTYTSAGDYSFTYSSAGTYIISISGTLTQFGRDNYAYTNADKIKEVLSWGNVGLTSLSGAFFGATNLTSVPATLPSTVTNMFFMFYTATSFNSANVTGWDVSNVTNMNYMFCRASSFNQNIGNWNVSNVTNMGSMFSSAIAFNQSLNNWNVGKVTNMASMFSGATAFNQSLNNWNVGAVTDMGVMFSYATSFNQEIGSWDVSKVTNMSNMFYGTYAFNKNIGSWNVGNVTNMSYMFQSAIAFNQNIGSWNVGKVTYMDQMFYLAASFNQDLSGWCVSRIVSVPYRFSSGSPWTLPQPIWGICSSQFQLKVVTGGGSVTLPLYGTVNATVYWGGAGTSAIEQTYTSAGDKTFTYNTAGTYIISISGTVTQFGNGAKVTSNAGRFTEVLSFGSVGLTSLSGAFNGATNLTAVPATLPSTVTDLSYMFKGATSFNSANDSLWDVSNVTNMSYMFYGASVFNRNIGSWNVGNVTNMSNMFYNASAFNQNIGSWVVSKVTNMDVMFMGASAFNQDIGNWNVGNVTTMNNMFTSAAAFNKNIGTWNVANVTSMSAMFSGATVFNQNIGIWNVGNVTNMIQMFYNASSFNQDLSGWCVSRVPSIPSFFATGANAWVLPKPVWGTCTSQFQLKVIVTDGSKSVSLPLYGTVNVAVNWGGSGTTAKDTTYTTAGIKTYTYASAGTYIIGIQGTLTQFGNGSSAYSYANKITEMISFGSVGLTSLSGAFNGATSLTSVPATLPSTVTNTSYMFKDATSFNSANDTGWNVSNVTDMSSMFSGATMYNKNIGNWNVSNVTTMNSMFYGASAFNQNIGSWNTGKVTDMTSMFQNAVAFNQNLSGWCVSRITTIPSNFSTGASAWVLAKPVWGSCSSQFVIKVSVPTASCFVTLPLQGTVNATVYWGGAGTTAIETTYTTAGIKSFTYSAAGTYTISIAGTVTQFGYGYTTDTNSQRFTEVVSFGSVGLTSLSGAFNGASNLTSVPATLPSTVTNTSSMFYGASKFNSANVAGWDVSNVTNMESMFALASTFNQNIGAWNVSNVTNMGSMFYGANAFNGNIGSWNVGNVANMANMFQADASFNQNIGGWNVSKVQNMAGMFNGATSFNQNIGNWNVGNVTNMTSMFYNAAAFNGDLSGWCVSRITTIPSNFSTGATAWLLAKPVWGICSSQFQLKVTVAAGGQVTLPLYGTVNATVYWGGAGTTAIETTYTTTGDKKYTYTSAGTYIISISGTLTQFGNGAAANTNGSKFTEVISFGSVGLTSLSGAFNGATRLTSVPATLPSTVTDLSYMFKGAALFNSANDTGWNVSNVTNMSYMFYGASVFNQNISSWNVGAVTDMQVMFAYAYSFNQNIGSWDVSKVTIMNYMFLSANTFNADIGSWNVGNVTNMSYMFSNATAFNKNIGSWDVGKVTNMNTMFQNAVAFNQDLSGWCVSRIASMPTDFSTGATAWLLAKPVWGICSSQFQLKVTVTSVAKTVTLPLRGTVNATVYWGGSGTTAIEQTYTSAGDYSFTYSSAGTYIISISGTVTQFGNGVSTYSNADKITKVISFGSVGLTSLSGAFNGATSLDSVPATQPGTVTNLSYMFKGATSFNSANITGWNVSKVADMSSMFYGATAFNQNISSWPIRKANTMAGMFSGVTISEPNYSALLTGWYSYSDTVRTITAFANGGTSATTVTTSTPHYFSVGDTVIIGGTTNYNGRWKVTAVSGATQCTIAKSYVAETPSVSSTVVLARIRYVTFNGGNSAFSPGAATTARQNLISNLYWTITDGGSLPDLTTFYVPDMILSGRSFGVATEYTLAGIAHPFAGNVTLTVASGPGTLSGNTTAAAVNGIAGFSGLSLSAAGNYTLQASSSAMTSTSSSFKVYNYTAGGSGDGHTGYGIASYGLDGVPVFQWSGITSDWFTGSNWSRGTTPSPSVLSERILIPPVATLPVISGTTANNLTLSSELIVKDQATLTLNAGPVLTLSTDSRISTLGTTGRLVITSGASFLNYSTSSPRIEAHRAITGSKGWRLLSGPVKSTYSDLLSGFVSQGFTGATYASQQPNFLWFDETDAGTTLQGWRKPAQMSDSTTTGRGYFLYVFNGAGKPSPLTGNYGDQLPITMNVIGNEPAISASGYNFNVTRTFRQRTPSYTPGNAAGFIDVNLQDQGWNLISNPTTSTINWNASSGWTKTNIGNSIYVWDPSASSGNGAYLTWNGSVGDLGSGLIAPFQSFWIKADSLPVLKMNNSVKTVGGTFRKVSSPDSAENFPSISLRLRSGDLLCDKFITFTPSGKLGLDDLDAYSLVPLSDTYVTLFSQSADGQPSMKIQNLPLYGYEVPLIFPLYAGGFNSSTAINGIFTLNWTFNGTVPDGWKILLVDDGTKKAYPLTEAGSMEFSFATPASLYDRQASSVGMAKSEPGSLFEMPVHERNIESESNEVQHIAARRTAAEPVKKMAKTTSAVVPELVSAQTVATEKEFDQTYDGGSGTTWSAGDSVLPAAVMVNPYPRVQRVMQKNSGSSLGKTSADENRFRIAVLPGREWDIEGYIPRTPEIHQNYPNPFNPATSIKFSVPKQTRVRLEVFNVLGQRVTTLADQEFQAGFHTVTWNARGVASGMYLCRFAADKELKTIKMILLK